MTHPFQLPELSFLSTSLNYYTIILINIITYVDLHHKTRLVEDKFFKNGQFQHGRDI